eukprot:TRINITY_DN1531_c1_g3_i1.p1 TRINITY_DN1531_c1_g3~~TRINITY_DN1531_c1_g3_i1.p1  ORF type:complete len:195 (-),score=6.89 TRINITY_DN1531_c1_g3_i1:2100-2684(-)
MRSPSFCCLLAVDNCGSVVPGYSFIPLANYFIFSNRLAITYGNRLEDCIMLCNLVTSCSGFRWNAGTLQCFTQQLYGLRTQPSTYSDSYVKCLSPSPPPGPPETCGRIYPNYVYVRSVTYLWGDNINSTFGSTPDKCKALCDTSLGCVGFLFNFLTAQCFAKPYARSIPLNSTSYDSYLHCSYVSPPPPPILVI